MESFKAARNLHQIKARDLKKEKILEKAKTVLEAQLKTAQTAESHEVGKIEQKIKNSEQQQRILAKKETKFDAVLESKRAAYDAKFKANIDKLKAAETKLSKAEADLFLKNTGKQKVLKDKVKKIAKTIAVIKSSEKKQETKLKDKVKKIAKTIKGVDTLSTSLGKA